MAVNPGTLDKLQKLRKVRVDNAVRDLAERRRDLAQLRRRLAQTEAALDRIAAHERAVIARLAQPEGRSYLEFAGIQGDLAAVRQQMTETLDALTALRHDLAAAEQRVIEARRRWRELEKIHDRGDELVSELKRRGLMQALAMEELSGD